MKRNKLFRICEEQSACYDAAEFTVHLDYIRLVGVLSHIVLLYTNTVFILNGDNIKMIMKSN